MTTVSNALKTNSIDRVTSGILTIGGDNTTSVSISDNVAVTGVFEGTGGIKSNSISSILTTDSISLSAPSGLSLSSSVGTTGQYLGSNAGGQPTWQDLPSQTVPTLNEVLTEGGNTTTNTATFTDTATGSVNIVSGNGVTTYNTTSNNQITIDSTLASINIIQNTSNISSLSASSIDFTNSTSTVGIQINGTALQLNTNGILKLNGLTGSNGQLLSYSDGDAVWADAPVSSTVQSGVIPNPSYNATTATLQSFATSFIGLNPPAVTLTVNTGTGSTSIVLAGIAGYQSTGSGANTSWSGFNWFISSAVPAGGYLNWIASPG